MHFRRSVDHNYIHLADSITGTTLRRSFQIPIRPWCLLRGLHPGPCTRCPAGPLGSRSRYVSAIHREGDTRSRSHAGRCVGAFRGGGQRRWRCVDNQDYVGGYTRGPAPAAWQPCARPASSYSTFTFSLLLLRVPTRLVPPPTLPAGPGPWDPLWGPPRLARHRRVARVPVPISPPSHPALFTIRSVSRASASIERASSLLHIES